MRAAEGRHTDRPAVLFDLDGTLIDSVYQHVLAWKEALESAGIPLSVWRIHRRIGMSGGLFLRALVRETGRELSAAEADRLRAAHEEGYARRISEVRALPGAQELLDRLSSAGVPLAIATSSSAATAKTSLTLLQVPEGVPVITRDRVEYAKPNPDLFIAAAEALDTPVSESFVVGDSVWDQLAAQRAHALGVGVLSGGYGREELASAGAYRVYDDPEDLLRHIDELGIRTPA
ncbi:MAG TPA: HAD family hydrolase [Candidatus Dormibacteraeota bacterium]|nr:HAD family hydrolase [Candidatus Dormibacteraeota bacterium]